MKDTNLQVMTSNKPLLIVVVGPTAIGKTSLAISIAKNFSADIISADSRQFYKEMSIGTAVPDADELTEVRHHFIQNKSIFENYSVGDFERDAREKLSELFSTNEIVVMVGGSGLYVDAVVKGLDDFPDVNPAIRKKLNAELNSIGLQPLQNELRDKDPEYFKRVDHQNPHRVIRALEIIRQTGKPYSFFLGNRKQKNDFDTLLIGLTAERSLVYNRINSRVELMMENGLLEEAKALYAHRGLNALQTVGYKELFSYFDGDFTLAEAIEEIKKNTRRFAKRQGTWFRKNEAIHWFDHATGHDSIIRFIEQKKAL
jgi:tRNA dimethylallyltransferase